MIAVFPACLFSRSNLLAFRPAPLFYSPSGASSRFFLERPLIFFSGSFYHSYSVFKDRREVSLSPLQPNRCAEGCQGGKAYFFRLPFFVGGFPPRPSILSTMRRIVKWSAFFNFAPFFIRHGVFPWPLYLIHAGAERQGIF